jgi:hypothetical protein
LSNISTQGTIEHIRAAGRVTWRKEDCGDRGSAGAL